MNSSIVITMTSITQYALSRKTNLVSPDPPIAVAHRDHHAVTVQDSVGIEVFVERADPLLTRIPAQPGAGALVEPHDPGSVVIVAHPSIGEYVIDRLPGDAALLHALSGMAGEMSLGLHRPCP